MITREYYTTIRGQEQGKTLVFVLLFRILIL